MKNFDPAITFTYLKGEQKQGPLTFNQLFEKRRMGELSGEELLTPSNGDAPDQAKYWLEWAAREWPLWSQRMSIPAPYRSVGWPLPFLCALLFGIFFFGFIVAGFSDPHIVSTLDFWQHLGISAVMFAVCLLWLRRRWRNR